MTVVPTVSTYPLGTNDGLVTLIESVAFPTVKVIRVIVAFWLEKAAFDIVMLTYGNFSELSKTATSNIVKSMDGSVKVTETLKPFCAITVRLALVPLKLVQSYVQVSCAVAFGCTI